MTAARFNFLDNLELDILGAYDDLFQALTMPTLRIDNLLDDLRDLLPTDFNLPCDLGDEFADFALGNDGGGDDGDGSSPPPASAVSALRATISTTKKKPFVAYIFLADVLKNGISNILARKAKQVKSVVKAVTRKQRLMAQKAKLAGKKFVAKLSLASPITVGAGAIKYATSVRVNPIPMLRQKLYVIFQLVEKAVGKVYKGPKCYLPVNHKTGSVQSATRKGTRQSFLSMIKNGVRSAAVFPLQFNATVNPWKLSFKDRKKRKVSLDYEIKSNPRLPTGTCDDLCPANARCDKTKMSVTNVGQSTRRALAPRRNGNDSMELDEGGEEFTPSFRQYFSQAPEYFVRKETYGMCIIFNIYGHEVAEYTNIESWENVVEYFLEYLYDRFLGKDVVNETSENLRLKLCDDIKFSREDQTYARSGRTIEFRKFLYEINTPCKEMESTTELEPEFDSGGIKCNYATSKIDEGYWGGRPCNHWDVEHMYDLGRAQPRKKMVEKGWKGSETDPPGIPHLVTTKPNSIVNFVMAWARWNREVSPFR